MVRRKTRKVKVGLIEIGGDAPVSVQSMTNTDTRDIEATQEQVVRLEKAGCDIVRLAIFDEDCIKTIQRVKDVSRVPIVADIHFDYKLAVAAIENGIDKLRINPGNIGSKDKVKIIVDAARDRKIPIRIGVNAGSLKREYLERLGNTPEAMGESALEQIHILEKLGYEEIVVSLKASSVIKTVEAYEYISSRMGYPLHLGITESGTTWSGTIKSSIGIGSLLLNGIGDTIRVSLTADPVEEVKTGIEILKALGLRRGGIEIISCPTCGRCNIDLIEMVGRLEEELSDISIPVKVAVMGCVVNGPGEAKEADIGIAGGKGKVVLFKKGTVIGTFPQERAVDILSSEIREMIRRGCSGGYTSI